MSIELSVDETTRFTAWPSSTALLSYGELLYSVQESDRICWHQAEYGLPRCGSPQAGRIQDGGSAAIFALPRVSRAQLPPPQARISAGTSGP